MVVVLVEAVAVVMLEVVVVGMNFAVIVVAIEHVHRYWLSFYHYSQ